MSDPLNRKPWPMKWVALAILACLVPYTILTVKYRKTTPAYQPYEDSKKRANVLRLLDAGYQRLTVQASRPAEPQDLVRAMTSLADPVEAPGGLTEELKTTLVEMPELPASFSSVSAPREIAALLPYPIVFTCAIDDQKHQLAGAEVFLKDATVVIVASLEPLDGNLKARTKESPVAITLPGGALKSGTYTVLLAGATHSRQWTLTVR